MTADGRRAARAGAAPGNPWRLRARQVGLLAQGEARRSLLTRRRIWMYLLALGPLALMAIRRAFHSSGAADAQAVQDATDVFAGLIQLYYIRLGLFFSAMGVFTWLFRGEMVERTLHYPFLTPLRREVLVLGKFLGGAALVIAIFEIAVIGCFYLLYGSLGPAGAAYMIHRQGLEQLGSYVLVVALATLGYGSVFLGLSLVFKNPIVPGAVFFGWEAVTPVFPAWLQCLSVTFYLKHLYPVGLPEAGSMRSNGFAFVLELFTVPTEPISATTAVAGLLVFTLAVLAFACYRIRRLEIAYVTD